MRPGDEASRSVTAIITGASSGIGRCTAALFAARGWRVGLIARGLEGLEATAAEIRSRHGAIVRPSVGSALILSPPLVIEEDELNLCVDAIAEVLTRTDRDGVVHGQA